MFFLVYFWSVFCTLRIRTMFMEKVHDDAEAKWKAFSSSVFAFRDATGDITEQHLRPENCFKPITLVLFAWLILSPVSFRLIVQQSLHFSHVNHIPNVNPLQLPSQHVIYTWVMPSTRLYDLYYTAIECWRDRWLLPWFDPRSQQLNRLVNCWLLLRLSPPLRAHLVSHL